MLLYWFIIMVLAGVASNLSTTVEQGEAFLCFYVGIFCIATFICFISKRKSMFCKVNLIATIGIVIQSFLLYKVFVLTNMPPVSFYFVYEMLTFTLGILEVSNTFKVKP